MPGLGPTGGRAIRPRRYAARRGHVAPRAPQGQRSRVRTAPTPSPLQAAPRSAPHLSAAQLALSLSPAPPSHPALPALRRSLAHPPAAPAPPPPPPLAAQRHDCRSLRPPRRSFWAGPAPPQCPALIGSPGAQPPSDGAAPLPPGCLRASAARLVARWRGQDGAVHVCLPFTPPSPLLPQNVTGYQ